MACNTDRETDGPTGVCIQLGLLADLCNEHEEKNVPVIEDYSYLDRGDGTSRDSVSILKLDRCKNKAENRF